MPEEECKGGDCPLRPQFDESAQEAPGSARKVRLTTSKYVQLLIDARETDPDCWPPGLEQAAGMIEQARAIEDGCIERWGEFDPDKLSREQSRRYFEIQLALDALQEEAGDQPLDLQSALSEARDTLDSDEAESAGGEENAAPSTSQPPSASEPGGYALPTPPAPPLSEGFFARGLEETPSQALEVESFFFALPATREAEDEEAQSFFLDGGWPEMPPLQRGDNYA